MFIFLQFPLFPDNTLPHLDVQLFFPNKLKEPRLIVLVPTSGTLLPDVSNFYTTLDGCQTKANGASQGRTSDVFVLSSEIGITWD